MNVGDRRMLLANGQAGELVAAGDPGALAEGIAGLLENAPALRAKSTAAASCEMNGSAVPVVAGA